MKLGPCLSVEASMQRWAELEKCAVAWHEAPRLAQRAGAKTLVANGLGQTNSLFHGLSNWLCQCRCGRFWMRSGVGFGGSSAGGGAWYGMMLLRLVSQHQPPPAVWTSLASARSLPGRAIASANPSPDTSSRAAPVSATGLGRRCTVCGTTRDGLRHSGHQPARLRQRWPVKGCMAEKGVFDLLVNCAGVARFEKIMETTKAAFDFQIGVNYRASHTLRRDRQRPRRGEQAWKFVHI